MTTRALRQNNLWLKIRPIVIVGGALLIMASLAYWGGAASPLPANSRPQIAAQSLLIRQSVGVLAVIGSLSFSVGQTA